MLRICFGHLNTLIFSLTYKIQPARHNFANCFFLTLASDKSTAQIPTICDEISHVMKFHFLYM